MADQWQTVTTGASGMAKYWPGKSADRTEGMEVVGVYKETREVTRPDGTKDTLHVLESKEGLIGVNGHFSIDDALAQVAPGRTVRITFLGKSLNPKTHRNVNKFRVDVAANVEAETKGAEAVNVAELPF